MPYLIVEKINKNHRIFRFSSEIKIGRGGDNDIILCDHGDSSISRNHMYIRAKRGGGYVLLDTSSNGTYIKGKPVKECFLADGLKFTINDYSFTFIDGSAGCEQKEPGAGKKRVKKVEALYSDDEKTICTSTSHQSLEEKFKLKRELLEAGIIVENETMLTVFMDLKEISKINVPVLLVGEPGAGKEIVTRTLHNLSENDGDFVPLHCSAFPEALFERELFGSGNGKSQNSRNKPGKLELADNGTLFLDEVGDMSLALQGRLLRFMEDRKVTGSGEARQREISLRLVSATNRELGTMMENGEFLGDLYQRLACITLNIPPLRERKEDIIPLANFFLGQYAKEHGVGVKKLSADAERIMIAAEWPDNVSELKKVLRNAVLQSNGSVLNAADLPLTSEEIGSETMRINPDQVWSMEEMEKRQIVKALEQSNGVKLKAAKILGISRDTLYKKIKKYRI